MLYPRVLDIFFPPKVDMRLGHAVNPRYKCALKQIQYCMILFWGGVRMGWGVGDGKISCLQTEQVAEIGSTNLTACYFRESL
jgi:hypothetical protein